jgi:hypothetical protein
MKAYLSHSVSASSGLNLMAAKTWPKAVMFLIGLFVFASAWSKPACNAIQDRNNQLAVGAYPLGLPKAELPGNLERAPCGTSPSPDEEVCEYNDIDGFSYWVDKKEVIRVEAKLGVLTKFGRLPLDLKLGDTRKIVLTKLAKYTSKLPAKEKKNFAPIRDLGKGRQYQESTWATFDCVANSIGVVGSWYLTFDEHGRLIAVGARMNI